MESVNDASIFQSMGFMACQTLLFVAAWKAVDSYVSRHGPIAGARKFTLLNSWAYSVASFALLILIASPSHEKTARGLYHASKFWEYVDVLGVRAGGGLIDLHFGFHHLTTPYLSYVRVVLHSDGWRWLAMLNALHHGLMYAYFGGAGLLRPVLEVTGTTQLAAGIVGEIWMLWKRIGKTEQVVWPHAVGLALLSTYLVLWARDVRMRRQQRDADAVQDQPSSKKD